MVLDLRSVLANIRPVVMETVSVLPFGNSREDRKSKWRKYGTYFCNIYFWTIDLME